MIRLAAPSFLPEDRDRIEEVLQSGQLVQGRFVAAFEALVAAHLGEGVHVLACSSGTSALHLAALALELPAESEVIVPAFTWPSTAHVLVQAGLRPVFVDIDAQTLNLDPNGLEAVRTERTRAVLPVHLFGIPAPMRAVLDFAARYDLRIIEDAACALGTMTDAGVAGTIGDLGCFSLHPRKTITTAEGGLVTTRDAGLAERVGLYRNHGMVRSPEGIRFEAPGLNYRLTELQGALGIGQMAQLASILAQRGALGRHYIERLEGVDGVEIPGGLRDPGNAFQSLTVRVDAARRPSLMAALRDGGVESTIGTYAVTSQPWYIEHQGTDPARYPEAARAQAELLTLPLHPGLTFDDVDLVIGALRAALQRPSTPVDG